MMPFLLVVGAIIGLIGFVLVLIAAFRENVWWGFGILAAELLPSLFIKNLYAASAVGTVVVLAFVAQHWQEARVGFIAYVVGTALVLPPLIDMMKRMETAVAQQQVAEAKPQAPAPERTGEARQVAAVAPNEPILPTQTIDRTPKAPSTERPMIDMKPVQQVYVLNATKKYYPIECAARPEGAYRMAKSLAKSQGYTLSAECTE